MRFLITRCAALLAALAFLAGVALAETVNVTFLLTNDIYKMAGGKARGGFARLAAVAAILFAHGAFAADWVEESDENTRVVLRSQSQFFAESASGLGLEEFDQEIMDLRPNLYERNRAEDLRLVSLLQERLRTAEHPKVIQDLEIMVQALQDGDRARLEHRRGR